MKAAVALLALCALLAGTAPRAVAEDDADTATAPGAARGAATGQAPRSAVSSNGPGASSTPGGDSTQLDEPEDEDAPSPPDADPRAQDPYESAPSADEGYGGEESSVLAAPEGRGARAHIDPYAVDPYDTDPYDGEGD